MEKMLNEWIDRSCDRALVECAEYMEKEYSDNYSETELRIEAERIIYKRAVKDVLVALQFFKVL